MKINLTALSIALALSYGCGQAEMPNPEAYSPYGIGVILNGYAPDLNKLDKKYIATCECLGYGEARMQGEKDDFIVKIAGKTDKLGDGFPCSQSRNGRCNGLYDPETNTIKINETLGAFSHELVHHLKGKNSNNNGDVKTCGDGIDGIFND